MSQPSSETALVIGAGPGLSASFARLCHAQGMQVHLAGRTAGKLDGLCEEMGATAHVCDVSDPASVATLFDAVGAVPDVVLFNPSARIRGPVHELDPVAVRKAIEITCFGGCVVGHEASKRMLPRGSGTILFTGASASVKGYPNSSTFAMGKFGLRGLCQSMARELHPQGIHIGHFIIDGAIRSESRIPQNDEMLDPDAIAETYMHVHRQHRSAWTWEIELRPWVERF